MTLDRAGFEALARDHNVVPVWRELAADTLTPVAGLLRLDAARSASPADADHLFLLESAEGGERWGRYSFLGRHEAGVLVARGGTVQVSGRLAEVAPTDVGVLGALRVALTRLSAPRLAGLPPLQGGLVGFLGYDVVRELERLPGGPGDGRGDPDAVLALIGELAAFDHWRQRVLVVATAYLGAEAGREEQERAWRSAQTALDQLEADLLRPAAAEAVAWNLAARLDGALGEGSEWQRTMSAEAYEAMVARAKEHILAGDIFQIVLSQRFDVDLGCSPLDFYRALRLVNPSPYLYYLAGPEGAVVGSSPEALVRVRDGIVTSRPIAGTRRRGANEAEDTRLAEELRADPKERAEHVMLVDLARNDIGRVAEFGSVGVEELMTIELYSHVVHLTSQVSGRLRAGLGPIDVLAATMPAGTVSGAPKVRAMELIDALEPTRRGPYAGVVGYVDLAGNLDTAIAIRTMLVTPDGRASVQAGAGIVADSDPVAEEAESRAKAAALLAAVGPARALAAARQAAVAQVTGLADDRAGETAGARAAAPSGA